MSTNVSNSSSRELEARYALCIEYDGGAYSGWQAQKSPAVRTVQEELESALSKVADSPIKLTCAGRTDSGVHASAQIAHFSTVSSRDLRAWVRGTNSFVSNDISVLWAHQVSEGFHARFSASSRRYRYVIYNYPVRPALMRGLVTAHFKPLDASVMHEGGQYLLGEQDFTSYRGVACQSNTAMRNISEITVKRSNRYIIIEICANAFLLHMVRNIVGVLLEIGEGKRRPQWAEEVLNARDRSCAAVTANADGLYLVEVEYPAKYNLPVIEPGPVFLRPYL